MEGVEGMIAAAEESTSPPVFALEEKVEEFLDYESISAFVMAPQIRNTGEMRKYLERHYQPILEFTGATGVVQLHFWIDEKGSVARAEIASSSGSRSLDRLAIRVSRILRFAPAMRLGRPVRVLVRLPITFREVVTN
jgi:TonB family protein